MDSTQREHIERRLLRERERALRSLGRLEEAGRWSASTESGVGGALFESTDLAAEMAEREKSLLLASKEGRYLYRLEDALRRLYNEPEKFGLCRGCGQEIPFERLDALPHARYCLACKLREEIAA